MNDTFSVKIGELELQTISIVGKVKDSAWDERESKAITLEGTFAEISPLFRDGISWSIIHRYTVETVVTDENGSLVYEGDTVKKTTEQAINEYDNSDYNVLGDIIQHVDGTCTVCMGKTTPLEEAYEILLGGN